MEQTKSFHQEMELRMSEFKKKTLGITEPGKWRTLEYSHILPARLWTRNLWSEICKEAINHFNHEKIKWHNYKDNLLSSQILCVNTFFPLRKYSPLLDNFLKQFYPSLAKITYIDFEYIGQNNYLNEPGGRGYNRTSADVAITWEDSEGKNNILLLEFKFTELDFGSCGKSSNPDTKRCNNGALVIRSPKTQCYRSEVGRPYWDIILSPQGPITLEALHLTKCCPFKYDFYQLMRNQLLAHCLMEDKTSGFHKVEFAVCYDVRNKELLRLSHPVGGNSNPLNVWKTFLKNPDSFKYFTIQELLKSIDHACNFPNELVPWREYLRNRYGL